MKTVTIVGSTPSASIIEWGFWGDANGKWRAPAVDSTGMFRFLSHARLWGDPKPDQIPLAAVFRRKMAALLLCAVVFAGAGCTVQNSLSLYLDVTPSLEGNWLQGKFQNVGKSDLQIWESGFWPNTRIVCHDELGQSPPLTETGKRLIRAFSPGGTRDKNYVVTLRPFEVHGGEPVLLESVFALDHSKTYFVQIVYEEANDAGWKGSAESNVVRISPFRSLSSGKN